MIKLGKTTGMRHGAPKRKRKTTESLLIIRLCTSSINMKIKATEKSVHLTLKAFDPLSEALINETLNTLFF
ncbi:CLUMA_CG002336, isoform A [Clunio marinus]|uniref:CLUMA_CG002336, isoform A n=1 Tax=Clunio marinus TaxID=568069 RepID=A0A1J1HKU0_9DIPT|nr:CLUMA_CG002336, isoform A [Clunio marinus]